MVSRFFALVGPTGAGKTSLLQSLKRQLSSDLCVFLCDSNGCGDDTPYVRFTTRVSRIAQEGMHWHTSARSQLLLFWSRLSAIIEHDVAPQLQSGKCVIMDGFGGTILAHAMQKAGSVKEEQALLELHKSMIQHCVVGLGVPPPVYLLLKPSPEIACGRLSLIQKMPTLPPGREPIGFIKELNDWFDFYGEIPGQTVIDINADQPPDVVLSQALAIIEPAQQAA